MTKQWATHLSKQINLKQLGDKAAEPVVLAVCGAKREEFTVALRSAGTGRAGAIITFQSLDDLPGFDDSIVRSIVNCPDEASNGSTIPQSLPYLVLTVRTGEKTERRGSNYFVSSFDLAQLRKHVLPDIVREYRSHETAVAAGTPAFRPVVAARLTHNCATTCLKIAAASAIADHIPVLGLLTGGIASAGDTIAITALQMRMLLRIATAYGKKAEFSRLLELLPVIGGGYAWRTLAREASGFIPIAGIPIKAAIAYAGTIVVGQVATHYYETGLRMPATAMRAAYRDAADRAKTFARQLLPPPKNKKS